MNENGKKGDEFFDYLYDIKRLGNDNIKNINLVTVTIGKKPSKACYYLEDIQDLI